MAINKDRVLNVFHQFPNKELRPIEVWSYFKQSGIEYYDTTHIKTACRELCRDGKLKRRQAGKVVWYQLPSQIYLKNKVLQVFVDFPDREMRSAQVSDLVRYWNHYSVGKICAELHREGLLFQKVEGQMIWYCIAREMR